MWFTRVAITACLAATVASSDWLPGTRAVYNKWHETELQRWLSDHDIPYPTPATRKDVEDLVAKNWNDYFVEPYKRWSPEQLTDYLKSLGQSFKSSSEETADQLSDKVKANWYDTRDYSIKQSGKMRDWVWDTWSDSQIKEFCDKNGVQVPKSANRDTLLKKAQEAYDTAAKNAKETAGYPGDWLYSSWSDSDLKQWLDSRGIPAPQLTQRNKLIAHVRRNAYLAHLKTRHELAKAKSQSRDAFDSLKDSVLDSWDESKLQAFCDANGVNVPHGTKKNELRALIRQKRAEALGEDVAAKASNAYGAATSNVQENYAKATDVASEEAKKLFESAVDKWSDSRLKSYLDSRGIPVPQGSNTDKLRALVRKHSHKAASGWSAWTFDDFNQDELRKYLAKHGDAAAKAAAQKKDATQEELSKAAKSAYNSASSTGGKAYESMTSYLSAAATSASETAFSAWSASDLKAYLDSYGVPVPQGSNIDELRALARRQMTYFRYGTSSPGETFLAKLSGTAQGGWDWITEQLGIGFDAAKEQVKEADKAAREKLKEEL